MFSRLLLLPVALAAALAAQEKPPPKDNAGEPVDGLRTTLTMLKSDFGPGESLMARWQITNVGDKAVNIKLGRNHVFDFSFEARREGQALAVTRVEFKDYFSPELKLEPKEAETRLLDLRAIHATDPKWCESLGNYEVSLIYLPRNIKSGWAKFRMVAVAVPEAPPKVAPEITPELQERIAALIAQLKSPQANIKEQALKDLRAIGKPALPQLAGTVKANIDPELTKLCQGLIEEINKGIKPVKPPPPDDDF